MWISTMQDCSNIHPYSHHHIFKQSLGGNLVFNTILSLELAILISCRMKNFEKLVQFNNEKIWTYLQKT
jgi:hypothetical protein